MDASDPHESWYEIPQNFNTKPSFKVKQGENYMKTCVYIQISLWQEDLVS